jgi:signal transduction histidine kinase/HPt (histidine-containing phosphotransfer) domain-containing protein/BarA-like signal transduction histidine kinase
MKKNEFVTILYVEDQPDVRLFLSKILSRHYSNVLLAENGKHGLDLYEKHRPDIVISDIKMPVMDGLSMSARIKEINPKARIILTTAHNDIEYFLHSIDIGISQFLIKPIDREKLNRALDTCVEQVMLEKEGERLELELKVAEKSAKIKQQFLANISHEMRTPMNGIMAMTEILLKTPLAGEQMDYTLTIKKSAENLMEMINDLLDITELEQEKIFIKTSEVNIKKLFTSIYKNFEPQALEKGISLHYHISENLPEYLLTDKQRVTQVIKNLVTNAIKFTEKGSIELSYNFKDISKDSGEIQVDVSDTGIGIELDEQAKMFELFTQQNQSNSRSYEGLGIGLTLCRKIADLMGGRIELESSPGKGSRFSFIFPAGKISSGKEESNTEQQLNLNARVLYAEDKVVNQKVVTIILQNAGCKVDIATNGVEALEMFEEKKYDLILMDIQMPQMDGITAMKKLRKSYQSLPPIIGLSANALKADADHYIREGLDDYISKPLTPEKLKSRVAKWLRKSDSLQEEENIKIASLPEEKYNFLSMDDNSPVIDVETYNLIVDQTHGDKNLIRELYNSFISESENIIDDMDSAIRNNDQELLRTSAHALKGLSITIGANKIYHVVVKMDSFIKEKKYDESAKLLATLKKEFSESKKIIQSNIISPNMI